MYSSLILEKYSKIYNLKTLKIEQTVSKQQFSHYSKNKFIIPLLIYDSQKQLYLVKIKGDYRIPKIFTNTLEDIHHQIFLRSQKDFPNIKLTNIEPVKIFDITIKYQRNIVKNTGLLFVAQVRNENDLKNEFKLPYPYKNNGIFKDTFEKVLKNFNHPNRVLNPNQEEEIAINEKYKFRYLFHNRVIKKIILTPRIKKKEKLLSRLREKIGTPKNIVDVSCGDSHLLSEMITPKTKIAVGNDISWSQILISKPKMDKSIIFTNHDATHLPFKNNAFDVAICSNTIHHMPSKDHLKSLFKSLSRVAKNILIIEIEDPRITGGIPYLLNRYWYQKFLKDVGGYYQSFETFSQIIKENFQKTHHITFDSFRNIQGNYLIAEIKRK